MSHQILIFSAWAVTTALSLGFAVQDPTLSEAGGPVIAQLRARQGTVQFRQEGATLWADTGVKQPFQDGTLIATGVESTATIAFRNGREIVLGESSQVVLTMLGDDDDSLVTLLKGTVESRARRTAAAIPGKPQRLIINSGTQSVALAKSGDGVTVQKRIDVAAPKIAMLGGLPLVTAPVRLQAVTPSLPASKLATSDLAPEAPRLAVVKPQAVPAPVATVPEEAPVEPRQTGAPVEPLGPPEAIVVADEPEAIEMPVVTPAPKSKAVGAKAVAVKAPATRPAVPEEAARAPVKVSVPRLVSPSPGVRLWTTRSLKQGGAMPLNLTFAGGAIPSQDAETSVELLRDNSAVRRLSIERSGGRYVASLGRDAIAAAGVRGGSGLTLSLRARVEPRGGAALELTGANAAPAEIELASLADVEAGSVTVAVGAVAPRAGDGWIQQRAGVTAGKAAARVHLVSSNDLPRLATLLRGADTFSILPKAPPLATADSVTTSILRGGKLAAQVEDRAGGKAAALHVHDVLNADLTFTGPFAAYLGTGAAAERGAPDNGRPANDRLYVLDRAGAKLTEGQVRVGLLRQQPKAWDVLKRNAQAVFSEPVSLLAPRVSGRGELNSEKADLRQVAAGDLDAQAGSLRIPKRLIFVEGLSDAGEPRFLKLDHRRFNGLGILTAASGGQSAFAFSLNPATKQKLATAKVNVRDTSLALQAMTLAQADAVVLSPSGAKEWLIAVADGRGGLRPLAKSPAPPATDAATVHNWTLATLGVKDRITVTKGAAALVLAPSRLATGAQGLVVSDSGTPRAIVEVVAEAGRSSRRQAIVRLVSGDSDLAGTRILWE